MPVTPFSSADSATMGGVRQERPVSELFDRYFELSPKHRITASQLCAILHLAGCTEKEKQICVWLNDQFGSHDFVRKVRPKNVRTWVGIKPRVELVSCSHCGANRICEGGL